jgi:hypothetical protein
MGKYYYELTMQDLGEVGQTPVCLMNNSSIKKSRAINNSSISEHKGDAVSMQ